MESKVTLALKEVEGLSLKKTIKILCAEKLDYGLFRDVYVMKADRRFVVKIERDMGLGQFANVTEWRNYINNMDWKEFEKWLAPCYTIVENGRILIQKRVYSYPSRPYPAKIPSLFTDLKKSNFGWIGDRFVCCDYSYLLQVGKFYLKRAKWWDIQKLSDNSFEMKKLEQGLRERDGILY